MHLESPDSRKRVGPLHCLQILVCYCRTTSASTEPCTSRKMCCPTHCASCCAPCQPLVRAFSGWMRSPPTCTPHPRHTHHRHAKHCERVVPSWLGRGEGGGSEGWRRRCGPWHYIHVYSIESRLIMRVIPPRVSTALVSDSHYWAQGVDSPPVLHFSRCSLLERKRRGGEPSRPRVS